MSEAVLSTIITSALYVTLVVIIIVIPHFLSKYSKTAGKVIRTSREELGLTGLPTWTDIGLAPIGFIVSLLFGALLAAAFSFFPWFDIDQVQDVGFQNLFGFGDRLAAFIALVIVAPIAEELLFRGWLYGKLRRTLPLIPALLIVSVLFAALHGQWNVAVNVFAMSVVLCGMREITGTIYSGILLHMLKNGIAFYLLFVIGVV